MSTKNPTRRQFLKTTGLGAAGVALNTSLGFASGRKPKRPNILFIMTDDHAAQAVSAYGSKINRTPNIDRLAREGMLFENAFCTNSLCAPSRATILTGKYSHVNGVRDNRDKFDGTQETFPKLLQKAGYQTAMIGKWHLKSMPTGFDYWNILPGQGAYYNPDFNEMGTKKRFHGYVTDITTDIALNWLDHRDKSKPFALLFQHKAPHRDWMPGPKYLSKYRGETIPEPDNLFDNYATRTIAARSQRMSIAKDLYPGYDLKLPPDPYFVHDRNYWNWVFGRLDENQKKKWHEAYQPGNEAFLKNPVDNKDLVRFRYQRFIKDYLRCIDSVDESVGRVLDYLDAHGLAENTLVVYTSDQGFFLGEHGWFDKRFMYEESLRMPLLMRFPKEVPAGATSKEIVLNLDFAPTFLDLAGVPKPPEMQGESFLKILRGKSVPNWRKAMYYHYLEYPNEHNVIPHYGIRTQRYKLIHFYYDMDAWELYDLEKDPHEMNNVFGDPAYEKIVENLKTELEKLRKKYGDLD